MKCKPSRSLSTLGSKDDAFDKNRRSSVTSYSSIRVFPLHPIFPPHALRSTLHIKPGIHMFGPSSLDDCDPDDFFQGNFLTAPTQPNNSWKNPRINGLRACSLENKERYDVVLLVKRFPNCCLIIGCKDKTPCFWGRIILMTPGRKIHE